MSTPRKNQGVCNGFSHEVLHGRHGNHTILHHDCVCGLRGTFSLAHDLSLVPTDSAHHIPSWDGSARTWRKYHREVSWYVRPPPTHKRQYCAHRLVGRLTSPARLLAMSWTSVSFDHACWRNSRFLAQVGILSTGVAIAAQRSRDLPAVLQFQEQWRENTQSFLVREALCYAEFSEAIIRLYEEKNGIQQPWALDFDLPPDGDEWEQEESGRPHWVGPGRVAFQEVLPHQEEGDPRRHILWAVIGSRIYRCSVHNVRPVTKVKRLQYEMTADEDPTKWKSLANILPKREVSDILDELPKQDEIEVPNPPFSPDPSTKAPKRRATGSPHCSPPTTGRNTAAAHWDYNLQIMKYNTLNLPLTLRARHGGLPTRPYQRLRKQPMTMTMKTAHLVYLIPLLMNLLKMIHSLQREIPKELAVSMI